MDTLRSLAVDVPAVWHDLTTQKQALIILKAIADFSFCGLTPVLFKKSHLSMRTLVLMPITSLCFVFGDIALFFALAKSADVTQTWIAIGLVSYSLLFFWWSQYTISRTPGLTAAFSSDEPTFLLTTGPWSVVRNPIYSAYLASMIAGFITTSSSNHPDHGHAFLVAHAGGIAFACLVVGFSVLLQAIREEEAKFNASKLRGQHEAYKKRVWSLLPLTDVFRR